MPWHSGGSNVKATRMGYCIQPNQCRVRFAPSPLLFSTVVALLLSLLSSLDCQFLTLIIPVTQEAEKNGPKSIGIGLGLWTFEVPSILLEGSDDEYANAPGKRMCASYSTARSIGGLTTTSGFLPYYEPFDNADRPWTLSRVFAVLGMISGVVACVVLVMILAKPKRRRRQSKVLIAQATTCAFLAESIKFGLFFNNYYCMSSTAWSSGEEDDDEVGSAECDLDRGSTASLLALLTYLGVSITILLHLSRPPNARHKIEYDRDEHSIPSFLHSVGISVENSKHSDGMSKNVGGSSSCGIAASENFIDRREYFRMQKHRPQLQTVTESSRAPSLPARPPPKKIALTTDQSVYTSALSSVGMGTAGLDGHSLTPGPRSQHSTRHGMHSSVVAASTAPSRIQYMEEKYHLPNKSSRHLGSTSTRDPKGLHRNMGTSVQSKRAGYSDERVHSREPSDTPPWLIEPRERSSRSLRDATSQLRKGGSNRHLHSHRSSNSSGHRLHYAPSSSRMVDSSDLSFQDLEEQAPRRERSYRSLGGGTSVGMGTVGHQGPAGSGLSHFGARGA